MNIFIIAFCAFMKLNAITTFTRRHVLMSDSEYRPYVEYTPSQLKSLPDANVWVLILNKNSVNEGIYAFQHGHEHNFQNIILAFECETDANSFSRNLFADGFFITEPTKWTTYRIHDFCKNTDFKVMIVATGYIPTTPMKNEYSTTYKYNKYRERLELLLPEIPENCADDDCTT